MQEEACELKGYVKVQLFDAKTGKLKHEQEGSNFITHATKATMKAFQARQIFMNKHGSVHNEKYYRNSLTDNNWNGIYNTIGSIGPFQYMILTDDNRAEDPATQQRVIGNFLAWANTQTTYSGTDTSIGTININESRAAGALNKITYVFDFATDVANGTFQTIWFSPHQLNSNTAIENEEGIKKITVRHVNAINAMSNTPYFFCDGSFIYTVYNNNIYSQNLSTDEYSLLSTSGAPTSISHICRDAASGLFYCARPGSTTLYVYDPAVETWATSLTSSPNATPILTAHNGYIFTGDSNAPGTFRRILASNNSQFDDWSLGLSESFYNFYVDSNGYHFFTKTKYYKADTWGGALVFQGHMGTGNNTAYGIWEGKVANIETKGDRTVFFTYDLDIENATAASRKLLPDPITKTVGEVMKITYTFEIV